MLRVIRRGAPAVPILVADVVAVPCLALFPVGILFADARYALPLPPQLSMGLGAWFLMLPARLRSFAVIAAVPTTWAIVLCVPVQHHQARVDDAGPGWAARQVVRELHDRDLHYLRGDYWGTFLVDYPADGALRVEAHFPVHLVQEAGLVDAADPSDVALRYSAGLTPKLMPASDEYDLIVVGRYDVRLPVHR